MTDEEIINIALAVGFVVHSGWSWGSVSKMPPLADTETLRNFARAILAAEKEAADRSGK